jgi:hypothetical protein
VPELTVTTLPACSVPFRVRGTGSVERGTLRPTGDVPSRRGPKERMVGAITHGGPERTDVEF